MGGSRGGGGLSLDTQWAGARGGVGFLWIHGGQEPGVGWACYFLVVVRRLCIVGGFSHCGEQALQHTGFSGCGGQA